MSNRFKYRFAPHPVIYNNIQFRSRLESRWAAFFDLMAWEYTYEPYDLERWSPDFKLITEMGSEFLVEVKPTELIDKALRLKIANATGFSSGILLVSESPFNYPYPNCIGLTSIDGKTLDYKGETDFEFCTSVIMDVYGDGKDIHNLCNCDEQVHTQFLEANDFCTELWSEAGNKVQFLKPTK